MLLLRQVDNRHVARATRIEHRRQANEDTSIPHGARQRTTEPTLFRPLCGREVVLQFDDEHPRLTRRELDRGHLLSRFDRLRQIADQALAHLASLRLHAEREGHVLHDDDRARALVRRDALACPNQDVFAGGCRAAPELHRCERPLALQWMWDPDRCGVLDVWVLREVLVDLVRADLVATGLDDIVRAACEEQHAPLALPNEVALIGFAGAPWTVATYMVEGGTGRGFQNVQLWAYRDPTGFAKLIDCLVESTIAYLSAQVSAGAEIIQLFDSWAGVLPEPGFKRWVVEPTRRIVDALRERYPALPIIGFPRGAGLLYSNYFAETKVTAIGLDTTVPLGIARDQLQKIGPIQGNLDPLLVVAGGAAMTAATREIVTAFSKRPFIFNLGHGIVPETPPEHVERLVALVRNG